MEAQFEPKEITRKLAKTMAEKQLKLNQEGYTNKHHGEDYSLALIIELAND